jgi:hypothetical protein
MSKSEVMIETCGVNAPTVAPFILSWVANPDLCRKCHCTIWTVLSRTGFRIHLDVTLTSIADLLTILGSQRHPYSICRNGLTFDADFLSVNDIARGKNLDFILLDHDCTIKTDTWPTYWPTPASYTQFEEAPF